MALSRKEERALVQTAQQGSEAAMDLLMRGILPWVENWAYYAAADPQQAEDVCQEALIDIFKGLKGFDSRRHLKPWCRAITFNAAARCAKKFAAAIRWTIEFENSLQAIESNMPGHDVQSLDDRIDLKQAMTRLDPESRAILNLTAAGASTREIAVRLDMTKSTVHRRLDDARNTIKKELDDTR